MSDFYRIFRLLDELRHAVFKEASLAISNACELTPSANPDLCKAIASSSDFLVIFLLFILVSALSLTLLRYSLKLIIWFGTSLKAVIPGLRQKPYEYPHRFDPFDELLISQSSVGKTLPHMIWAAFGTDSNFLAGAPFNDIAARVGRAAAVLVTTLMAAFASISLAVTIVSPEFHPLHVTILSSIFSSLIYVTIIYGLDLSIISYPTIPKRLALADRIILQRSRVAHVIKTVIRIILAFFFSIVTGSLLNVAANKPYLKERLSSHINITAARSEYDQSTIDYNMASTALDIATRGLDSITQRLTYVKNPANPMVATEYRQMISAVKSIQCLEHEENLSGKWTNSCFKDGINIKILQELVLPPGVERFQLDDLKNGRRPTYSNNLNCNDSQQKSYTSCKLYKIEQSWNQYLKNEKFYPADPNYYRENIKELSEEESKIRQSKEKAESEANSKKQANLRKKDALDGIEVRLNASETDLIGEMLESIKEFISDAFGVYKKDRSSGGIFDRSKQDSDTKKVLQQSGPDSLNLHHVEPTNSTHAVWMLLLYVLLIIIDMLAVIFSYFWPSPCYDCRLINRQIGETRQAKKFADKFLNRFDPKPSNRPRRPVDPKDDSKDSPEEESETWSIRRIFNRIYRRFHKQYAGKGARRTDNGEDFHNNGDGNINGSNDKRESNDDDEYWEGSIT
jgi:hypothetical protein